jgi:putative transposase
LIPTLKELASQKECEILERKMMKDHVLMLIKIPPKHPVLTVIEFLKGKSAIAVARQFSGKKRNFQGEKLWAREYAVSTVGFEVETIRSYIQNQERLNFRDEEDSSL